ncbi:MAG: hypothetical protein IPL87_04490 [Candidatus Moraniibacteriota bacterium]|nr:MAG: hypothetical protein IPL87_04490 [Candidatus Moranbacteria bacterium]
MEKNALPISTEKTKLLAIAGPTASGKSSLAIRIAREEHGEIISVDSRQVYRGMDIGTGKVEQDESPHDVFFPRAFATILSIS